MEWFNLFISDSCHIISTEIIGPPSTAVCANRMFCIDALGSGTGLASALEVHGKVVNDPFQIAVFP